MIQLELEIQMHSGGTEESLVPSWQPAGRSVIMALHCSARCDQGLLGKLNRGFKRALQMSDERFICTRTDGSDGRRRRVLRFFA